MSYGRSTVHDDRPLCFAHLTQLSNVLRRTGSHLGLQWEEGVADQRQYSRSGVAAKGICCKIMYFWVCSKAITKQRTQGMPITGRLGVFALALTMGALMPCAAVAGEAPSAEASAAPRFEISRFEVSGNTLLTPREVDRTFAPYTGANKDFGDIQRALESLEQAYRNRGFGAVQVLLPEQDITRGVV